MLKDHIHGLHLVQVLRAVTPDVRSILVTGFASGDLRESAHKADVVEFIDKPFDRDRIRDAVRRATVADPPPPSESALGVLEVDSEGSIVFANPRAKELFGETLAGEDAANFSDLFPPETLPELNGAGKCWVAASPRAEHPVTWHMRSSESGDAGERMFVLRRRDEPQYSSSGLIEMLLGVRDGGHNRWPFEGRVLIIDDDALIRRCLSSVLEGAGAGCYSAENLP